MIIPSMRLRFLTWLLRRLPPEMRGKARLARVLLGHSLDLQDVLLEQAGQRFVLPSLREPVGFYLAIDGVYEGQVLDFILQYLPSNGVFVDIGANIGCITVPVALHLQSTGHILALEASPAVFPYLEQNIGLNHLSNVQAIQCAVAEVNGVELPFYQAPPDHFGMGSLAPQFDTPPIFVGTRTLDSLLIEWSISKVDVIKVDVEGFECGVFQGAEQYLRGPNPPILIFEFCDWAEERAPDYHIGDAQRLLQSWGYDLWRLTDYCAGRGPLSQPLYSGFETLVAQRR